MLNFEKSLSHLTFKRNSYSLQLNWWKRGKVYRADARSPSTPTIDLIARSPVRCAPNTTVFSTVVPARWNLAMREAQFCLTPARLGILNRTDTSRLLRKRKRTNPTRYQIKICYHALNDNVILSREIRKTRETNKIEIFDKQVL